jgi:hypothetical protein
LLQPSGCFVENDLVKQTGCKVNDVQPGMAGNAFGNLDVIGIEVFER